MISIVIVDDQNIVREGIKLLLQQAQDIDIIGVAENGYSAIEIITTLQPDVVLLDMEMPDLNGLEVIEKLKSLLPKIKIIILSSHDEEEYIQQAAVVGAKGYILKSASAQELEWSIKLVYQGYSAIKSDLLPQIRSSKDNFRFPSIKPATTSLNSKNSNQQQAPRSQDDYSRKQKNQQLEFDSSLAPEKKLKDLKAAISHNPTNRTNYFFHPSLWYRKTKNNQQRNWGSLLLSLIAFSMLFSLGFLIFYFLSEQ